MASLLLSTIAFFVASYFGRRYMDANDFPRGMVRSMTIFCAAAVAYGVGYAVEWMMG